MTDETGYWIECIASSLDEHGVSATAEQIAEIAKDVQGAHESMGLAFHVPENPLIREVSDLKKRLAVERDKVVCPECKGKCVTKFIAYGRESVSRCDTCRGEGKVSP